MINIYLNAVVIMLSHASYGKECNHYCTRELFPKCAYSFPKKEYKTFNNQCELDNYICEHLSEGTFMSIIFIILNATKNKMFLVYRVLVQQRWKLSQRISSTVQQCLSIQSWTSMCLQWCDKKIYWFRQWVCIKCI